MEMVSKNQSHNASQARYKGTPSNLCEIPKNKPDTFSRPEKNKPDTFLGKIAV